MKTDDLKHAPQCPSCGGSQVISTGKIPDSPLFAGRLLAEPLPGGYLWKCKVCTLKFRHPFIDSIKLKKLYETGSESAWQTPTSSKTDWLMARDYLESTVSGEPSVLDVGCFDGRFLSLLGNRWDRHGIEINPSAEERSRQLGINIVCRTIADMDSLKMRFDAVTAFDILEHVERPLNFIKSCARILRPEGVLIIATGDTSSFPWRLLGTRNLYAICSEHVSFVNPHWCNYAAHNSGLKLISITAYRHGGHSLLKRMSDTAANIAYAITPSTFKILRSMNFGNIKNPAMWDCPPSWPSAKDHLLGIFIRRDS